MVLSTSTWSFEKLREELTREPNMQIEEVARLAAPTLVLLGDHDMITPEHAAALVRTIPVAQLGIVPGAEHSLPMDKPDILVRLVADLPPVDFSAPGAGDIRRAIQADDNASYADRAPGTTGVRNPNRPVRDGCFDVVAPLSRPVAESAIALAIILILFSHLLPGVGLWRRMRLTLPLVIAGLAVPAVLSGGLLAARFGWRALEVPLAALGAAQVVFGGLLLSKAI
jgi:hypothetical protein